jgi:DNA-binding SARP family transcriptional activator
VANFQETEGQAENAIQTWETVHLINPYQTEMHEALIRLYQKTGNKEQEQEHLEYLNILKTGGAILIKGARNAE